MIKPVGVAVALSFLILAGRVEAGDPWVGYAAGGYNGKVLIFGVPSLKLLKEVPAGGDLHGPALTGARGNSNGTPDGKTLYAVDKAANKVVVMEMAGSTVSKKFDLPKGFGPNALDVTPDGKALCVAGELSGKIAKVDTATGKAEVVALPVKPAAPVYAAITKDGKYCLVSDYINNVVYAVTLSPFAVEKTIPSGGNNPHGIALTPDGKWALVTNKFSANLAFLDLGAMKVAKTVKTGAAPIHAVVDSKGQFAYQSAFLGNVVKKIDIAKGEVVDTWAVNSRPGHLGISPDDKTLLVLNKYSTGLFESASAKVGDAGKVNPTNIQLLDTATGKSIGQKPVPGEPFGIVLASASVVDKGLGAGKDAVAAGRVIDLPEKKEVKLTYGPARPHKPGVFDAAGGSEVYLNAFSHQFAPNEINVFKGDTIKLILQNIDEKGNIIDNADVVHGFTINGYADQTQVLLPRGVMATLEFKADKSGSFDFYCSNWCGHAHMEMRGKFNVE